MEEKTEIPIKAAVVIKDDLEEVAASVAEALKRIDEIAAWRDSFQAVIDGLVKKMDTLVYVSNGQHNKIVDVVNQINNLTRRAMTIDGKAPGDNNKPRILVPSGAMASRGGPKRVVNVTLGKDGKTRVREM